MDKSKIEAPRYFGDAELRVVPTEAGGKKIVGYAAVFNSLSADLGGFRERLDPGCFSDALRSNGEVLALVEHSPALILGRRSKGTLKLREDPKGLHVEIDAADTSTTRDLQANIEAGNIVGMSFRFPRGAKDSWKMENGEAVRTIHQCGLKEVTCTAIPAYESTSVSLRALTDAEEAEMRSYYEGQIAALKAAGETKVDAPNYGTVDRRLKMLRSGVMTATEARALMEYEDNSLVYTCREALNVARVAFDHLQRVADNAKAVKGKLTDSDRTAANDCISAVIDLIGKAKFARSALESLGAKDDDAGETVAA